MILDYRYDIAAVMLSIAIIIGFFRKKTINTRVITAFFWLIIIDLISSLSNIIYAFIINQKIDVPIAILYLVNIITYIAYFIIPYIYYYCIFFKTKQNRRPSKVRFTIMTIPCVFLIIMILITSKTKLIFYYDENKQCIYGKMYYLLFVCGFIYIISIYVRLLRYKKIFTKTQFFFIIDFLTADLCASIIQIFIPKLLIMNFVLALSGLFIYLTFENSADYVDSEMNLFNRDAFIVTIRKLLDRKKKFSIISVKMENSYSLNAMIGTKNRIELIRNIADSLKKIYDKKKIFRVSQTKISIILPEEERRRDYFLLKLNDFFNKPFYFNGNEINLMFSANIVSCPDDATTIEDTIDLIENSFSETYFFSDKNNEFLHADKSILEKRKREQKIIEILNKALKSNDFEIIYQPIFSVEKKKFDSAEALLRLKNKELGFISPEEFVPLAEKNGMMLSIGSIVFKTVCKFIVDNKIWEKGIEYIHINLSVIQCMQEKLSEQLIMIMDSFNLDYKYINLDILENATITAKDNLINNMNILNKKKVGFSLDAFGSGFSNTSSLSQYPFNIIKIDKKMIWAAMNDERAKIVLAKEIAMVKDLNMKILAEGVETYKQANELIEMNCDYLQGYHYSYPLSENDFINFMQ